MDLDSAPVFCLPAPSSASAALPRRGEPFSVHARRQACPHKREAGSRDWYPALSSPVSLRLRTWRRPLTSALAATTVRLGRTRSDCLCTTGALESGERPSQLDRHNNSAHSSAHPTKLVAKDMACMS